MLKIEVVNSYTMAAVKHSTRKMARIAHDVNQMALEPGFEIACVIPDKFNEFYIRFTPEDEFYKGIKMVMRLSVKKFPIEPFHIQMMTPVMFHPNISKEGSICVDFLYDKDGWVPEYTFVTGMRAFMHLLICPNADGNHLNADASLIWRNCQRAENFKDYKAAIKQNTGVYNTGYDMYFNSSQPYLIKGKSASPKIQRTQRSLQLLQCKFNAPTEEKTSKKDSKKSPKKSPKEDPKKSSKKSPKSKKSKSSKSAKKVDSSSDSDSDSD